MPGEFSEHDSRLLLKSGLVFSGRITASVTHELNNVVGTIMQVVGLIEDLAMTDEVRKADLSDKMLSVVERVERQADRGTALIQHLNAFAHLSDEDRADCRLGELLTTMANLSDRLVGLRKVSLKRSGLNQALTVVTSPMQLAQATFGCIQAALDATPGGSELELRLSERDSGADIDILVPDQVEPDRIKPGPDVELIADWMGLSVEVGTEDGRTRIRIGVPSRPEQGST